MKKFRWAPGWAPGLAIAGLLLVGAGCSGFTSTTVDVNAPAMEEGSEEENGNAMEEDGKDEEGKEEAGQIMFDLIAQNSSGVSGKALLIEEGLKTKVLVNLSGTAKGSRHPAHVHVGSCPNPGTVKFGLSDIVDGRSETTLDVSFSSVVASLPLAINVHRSSAELGVYYACGDLQDAFRMSDEGLSPDLKARLQMEGSVN